MTQAPRRRFRLRHALLLTLSLSVTSVGAYEAYRAFSFSHEKQTVPGVPNFGRVNPQLFRGAQPDAQGFAELKKLGVGVVVRLSLGEEAAVAERQVVEGLGMEFMALPWSTAHQPSRDQIQAFLTLVRDRPDKTIFVHCKKGADRTGVFIAAYRIAADRWTPTQAMAEMKAFHYHYIFLPHLQHYVEAIPTWIVSEPTL